MFSVDNRKQAWDWVQQEGPAIHPAFATREGPNIQESSSGNWGPSKDLETAMERYYKDVGSKARFEYSSLTNTTWDDVVKMANSAEQKYIADGGELRKFLRKNGEWASAIVVWLDLAPQGTYAKLIQGVLTRLFTAASKLADNRIRIMEAFQELTGMIQGAYEKRTLHPSNNDLKNLAVNLYETILKAMDEIISWFTDNPYKKITTYIVKGPIAGKKLDDLLERARRQLRAFQEKYTTLGGLIQRNVEASIGRVETSVGCMSIQIPLLRQDSQGTRREVDDHRKEFGQFINRDKDWKDEWKKSQAAGRESREYLIQLCLDVLHHAQWSSATRSPSPPIDFSKAYINQGQLLQSLAVDIVIPAQDIENMLRKDEAIKESLHGEGAWLLHSRQFQEWIASKSSEALLVDGNIDDFELERITPMSTLCAALIRSFRELRNKAPCRLSFFCGLHTASDDDLSGPRGLMRSLIAQLLRNYRFHFDFVNSHDYRVLLENHELGHLCETFRNLIYQLPAHTVVFCIVDGISLYERASLEDELEIVASMLCELSLDSHLGCFIKLLLTSPNQSRHVKKFFPRETNISLPPSGDCDVRDISPEALVGSVGSGPPYGSSSDASSDIEAEHLEDEDLDFEDNEDG